MYFKKTEQLPKPTDVFGPDGQTNQTKHSVVKRVSEWVSEQFLNCTSAPEPDLGGGTWGPRPQAFHQQGASHQTPQFLYYLTDLPGDDVFWQLFS